MDNNFIKLMLEDILKDVDMANDFESSQLIAKGKLQMLIKMLENTK